MRGDAILKQIPKKVDTASDKFNMKGRLVYYAVCLECKQTHKPTFKPGQAHPIYPRNCNNVAMPGAGPCGALLLERHFVGGLPIWRPILLCAYHELNDYVCDLECRRAEMICGRTWTVLVMTQWLRYGPAFITRITMCFAPISLETSGGWMGNYS